MSVQVSSKSIIDTFAPLDGTAIHVQQLRCAKVRNRNVACLKCADACTSGCISIEDGQLLIDAEKCVGCGTCATVCPTGALESRNPSDIELINTCADARVDDQLVFMCELAHDALHSIVDPDAYVRVVCAGRIDESLLCGLASQGVKSVAIVCGTCNNCEQAKGLETATAVIDTTRTLLQAWGVEMALSVSSEVPERLLTGGGSALEARSFMDSYFSSRRTNKPIMDAHGQNLGGASAETSVPDAREATSINSKLNCGCSPNCSSCHSEQSEGSFSSVGSNEANPYQSLSEEMLAKEQAQQPHKSFAERMHVKKDGTLPHFIPDRRDQLLCYLSEMGNPNAGSLNTRLWGRVEIDSAKCVSCQMCATFCPTGAISKFEDEDGTFGVNHYPGDCVKCGSCKDICWKDAITIYDEVSPESLLDGEVHRFVMEKRDVELGSPNQMSATLKQYIDAPIKDFS